MSIATQIQRLQNIKSAIRSALISKGIDAEYHNMADFAADIDALTDVRDTTATADDVLNHVFFYDVNGVKTRGNIEYRSYGSQKQLNPLSLEEDERSINFLPGYYPYNHGAYVNKMDMDMNEAEASREGTRLNGGYIYITLNDGYFYDHQPETTVDTTNRGKGTYTIEFPENVNTVYISYAVSTSASGRVTITDCDVETLIDSTVSSCINRLYKLTKTDSDSFTIQITTSGSVANNCHWIMFY